MVMATFEITLPKYAGPFDLILEAIRDGRIAIFEINLTKITSAYFEYMSKFEVVNLNEASEFIALAAFLIELKSKKLLPQPEEFEAIVEEEEIAEDLARHLAEYNLFKQAAVGLKERKDSFSKVYSRYHREVLQPENKQYFLTDVNLEDLVSAFQRVYREIAEEAATETIVDEEITLADRTSEVLDILRKSSGLIEFRQLFIRRTRLEVVVTFLSILELARSQTIRIMQGADFGTIHIQLIQS